MDINRIIHELKSERSRIDKAIATLEGIGRSGSAYGTTAREMTAGKAAAKHKSKPGGLTPEGRKKLSDLMKKRWAERKRKPQSSK